MQQHERGDLGVGRVVVDPAGRLVGRVHQAYADEVTGQPAWLAVATGAHGDHVGFVPFGDVTEGPEGALATRWPVEHVHASLHAPAASPLTPAAVHALRTHYGHAAAAGPGPDLTAELVLSDEHLRPEVQRRQAATARLVKRVELERVETVVPVRREEFRVVRTPVTEADLPRALAGPDLAEAVHEVVLHAEDVVERRRVVPVERVGLERREVLEQVEVAADVRREHAAVEVEGAQAGRPV